MKGFWNSKSEEEIKKTLRVNDLVFIGKFKKIYDTLSLFNNLRNVDYSPVLNLKSNIDERNFVKCEVLNRSNVSFIENTYYKISVKIIPLNKRIAHSNEFLLEFDNDCHFEEYIPNEKEFTTRIYDNHINANNANSIGVLKAVKTITYQINKKNETFIYELLQNADDYPSENEKVEVDFFITTKYLLFTHTGARFNFNNVYSLCAVNAEDKTDDFDKIGFKGIGFKSVFKANDYVYLNSGTYSFRFEKSYHNAEYPWQLMPIWTEKHDLELSLENNKRFLSSNVAIALRPRDTVNTLNEYSESLELFTDDRILLFLKNINKVNVFLNNEKKIFCRKDNKKWWLRNFEVEVNEEITIFLNTQINEGNEEIPSKFNNLKKCKISFAAMIKDNIIQGLSDAKLFNYLPLSINLNLPFLINADFIPDGEREGLINNDWNKFLLETSGYKFVLFIKETLNYKKRDENFKYSIFNLIPSFKTNAENLKNNEKWYNYFNSFKLGFESAIIGNEAIAFIPDINGKLEILSNILIDETGLAGLLEQEFYELTGITNSLIDNKFALDGIKNIKTLIKDYETGIIYSINDLKTDLTNPKFQEWLKIPENNFKIIQHFHTNKKLDSLLETEPIILTANNTLRIAAEVYNAVPDLVNFVLFEKVNEELLLFLTINNVSLELKVFNPVDFYNENILGKQNSINLQLSNELKLLNFWRFIYDYWNEFDKEDNIKRSLKLFNVLCKSLNDEVLYKYLISTIYISADYSEENEIESVITEIGMQDAKFISEKYISEHRNAKGWYRIFKQAQAITDLQKVIEVLLPRLSKIEEEKHFQIAKQIFKFWKDPSNKLTDEQIGIIKTDLKIKSVDNVFRKTNDCYISDYYNNNEYIASWLPNIEITNQITQEYAPKTNQVGEWKKFFALIDCVELTDKQNVFDAKINFIIASQEILKDQHFEILKSISDLHKARKENGLNFDFENTLSRIKLQTINDQWHLPISIHLSSSYKPKLNLENDEIINSTLLFLNEKYLPNEIEKYFFIKLGVKNNFSFNKIEIVSFKNFENLSIKDKLFNSEKFNIKKNSLLSRGYGMNSIEAYTKFKNHVQCYFLSVPIIQKYNNLFFDEVVKLNDEYFNETELINNEYSCGSCYNELISFIRENEIIENKLGVFLKPSMLYSSKLEKYIVDKSLVPKYNLLSTQIKNEKSIEEIIGIHQELSIELCLGLLSLPIIELTFEEIQELNIVKILTEYKLNEKEELHLFMLNKNLEWKSIRDLFFSNDENIQIEHYQHLHEYFYSLADNFGIQELSESSLVLKTKPETPIITNEIVEFFKNKAKFIAFKIDQINFEELAIEIIERIGTIDFYEVDSMVRVFSEVNLIYNKEIIFHSEDEGNKIIYNGNWKTNSELKIYLYKNIFEDKIPETWFENVINRWNDKKLIELLEGEYGATPFYLEDDNIKSLEKFWEEFSLDDGEYIKSIVNISYDQEGQLDANTAAKINTLMVIKGEYGSAQITDEGGYLKVGNDEIIVRSAQKGLLYLDLYHWKKLNKKNVKIAVYTNSQVNIYNSQEDLFQFCKPQNKFGVLRMPNDYTLDDYNSLDNITKKGKWHFVFIVNEDANAAKHYKEIIDLDEYNNYGS